MVDGLEGRREDAALSQKGNPDMNADQFLQLIRETVRQELPSLSGRIGTIPGTYSSGRPTVLFDGEATASTKTYPYLSSYAPVAGNRVALLPFGNTWLVIGRIV